MKKLEEVAELIKSVADKAGMAPGVYKMLNEAGKIIYIGKAKHLKNRLNSYARFGQLSNRTKMMVSNINSIEYIVVNSDVEALLLENNLIKKFKPFYNILLKDDKTFPYIVIDNKHEFPRIFKYRTLQPKEKFFFWPLPCHLVAKRYYKSHSKNFFAQKLHRHLFCQSKKAMFTIFYKTMFSSLYAKNFKGAVC